MRFTPATADRVYLHASTFDNPALPADYLADAAFDVRNHGDQAVAHRLQQAQGKPLVVRAEQEDVVLPKQAGKIAVSHWAGKLDAFFGVQRQE